MRNKTRTSYTVLVLGRGFLILAKDTVFFPLILSLFSFIKYLYNSQRLLHMNPLEFYEMV